MQKRVNINVEAKRRLAPVSLARLGLLCTSFLIAGTTQGFAASGWYDYGNGLINLAMTKYINGDMTITAVPNEGESYDTFTARCSNLSSQMLINVSITSENAAAFSKFAEAATEAKCAWQTAAVIKFDDFTLTLPQYSSAAGDAPSAASDDYVQTFNDVKQHL